MHVEVEDGVAVGLGAGELLGEAAVGAHLVGERRWCLNWCGDFGAGGVVADEAGELGCLQSPADGVVVLGVALLDALFAGLHPVEIVAEPVLERVLLGGVEECWRRELAARATSTRWSVSMMP